MSRFTMIQGFSIENILQQVKRRETIPNHLIEDYVSKVKCFSAAYGLWLNAMLKVRLDV